MSLPSIQYCPSSLKPGFDSYSPAALRQLFEGRKVSHILPWPSPGESEETSELFLQNRQRISISGVQVKLSLVQEKNKLRLARAGEQGTHILKPVPRDLKRVELVPANEHLSMQIAQQLYSIETAANAMIFFQDGRPAYITRRFDRRAKGGNWNKEDFASLAGKTAENAGNNYKYDYDYLRLGLLIQKFIPAWRVEIEKYFKTVLFNFLISNGDAHLKNFAALESAGGDYLLSPAYDLINTRLHVADTPFALKGGLLPEELRSAAYRSTGQAGKTDFFTFAREIGVLESRIEKLMNPFCRRQELVETLIERSFLDAAGKRAYLLHYNARRNQLDG